MNGAGAKGLRVNGAGAESTTRGTEIKRAGAKGLRASGADVNGANMNGAEVSA